MPNTTKPLDPRSRKALRATFDGSDDLFAACWRRIGAHIRDGYFDDPADALEQTASELVNDSASRFFVTG